ncbi:MAG TPA: NADH-quinone oxidoreductase subunit M [Acidobacteriaceae bacterium]|jgi:NADH-quinone oxidoreductase subunit M|nr:NADH-quinone oxidoreductase subunit M [Acidobacteriaceae bacterium]
MDNIILSQILITPLIGALLILLLPDRRKLSAGVALTFALLTFAFTLHLPAHFNSGTSGFQFVQDIPWIDIPAIRYHVGVDGLSLWLVVLTGLLAPIGVLASWNTIQTRSKLFYALFLVQQTAMLGVFVSLDLMLYYGFWELSLVPMAILIAMYGRTDGTKAALRFFLYTFIPSAPLLVALLWLYAKTHSFQFEALQSAIAAGTFPAGALCWAAFAFLVAFAVKVPVLGLHGWLPDTFFEAPVAMAMVVAGKLGLYSLIRFHVGLFPVQAHQAAPWMIALAAIGILYGALLALVQKDFWKLLAYGTISSLSFCTLGIYGFTLSGLDGAVFQTLNEGIIGAALFVLFGVLYSRYSTSQIAHYGGLAVKTPALATLFVVSSLAMIGLPLLNGFIGEFLVLSSTLTGGHRRWAALATLGVILSAAYMLTLVQRIFYGPQSDMVRTHPALDLDGREKLNLWPLAILMLVMGVAPNLFLTAIQTGLDQAAGYPALRARIEAAPGAKRMVITSSRPLPTTAGGQQ